MSLFYLLLIIMAFIFGVIYGSRMSDSERYKLLDQIAYYKHELSARIHPQIN